jgi:glycosyltransferase involved in cell wall biosynthesis
MAMARPVVGLATGGVSEFADADTGFVARSAEDDASRVARLADQIARARDERAALPEKGARARARVVSDFSRVAMARAYGETYRSVSARPRRD